MDVKLDVSPLSLGDSLAQAECLTANLSELLKEFRTKFIDPETGKFNVDSFEEGVAVAQVLWNKVKESASECYGEELVIDFGDSLFARIFQFFLAAVGFKI